MMIVLLAGQMAVAQGQIPSRTQIYSCECIDTGLECDGGEKMSVVIKGGKANLTITDRDGDFPSLNEAKYDATYAPTKNVDYYRYLNQDTKKPHRYFLIRKSMIKGSSQGVVKAVEVGGGGAYEWYYECSLLGAQG